MKTTKKKQKTGSHFPFQWQANRSASRWGHSKPERVVFVTFCCCDKIPWLKQPREERLYKGVCFQKDKGKSP